MFWVMNQEHHLCFCIWHSSCFGHISVLVKFPAMRILSLFSKNSFLRSDNAVFFYFGLSFLELCQDATGTYSRYSFWICLLGCFFNGVLVVFSLFSVLCVVGWLGFFNTRVMWSCSCYHLTVKCCRRLGNSISNSIVGVFLVLLKSCWLVCVLNKGAAFLKNFFNQKQ